MTEIVTMQWQDDSDEVVVVAARGLNKNVAKGVTVFVKALTA